MTARGWLGWWRARYEITPERVTLTRSWRPAALIPLLAVGIAAQVHAFTLLEARRGPAELVFAIMGLGIVAIVAGTLGLLSTPVFGPRSVIVTRDGVLVGAHRIAAEDVMQIGIEHRVQRGRGGNMLYTIVLAVQTRYVIEPYRMVVQFSRQLRPRGIDEVLVAMNALALSSQPAVPDDGTFHLPP